MTPPSEDQDEIALRPPDPNLYVMFSPPWYLSDEGMCVVKGFLGVYPYGCEQWGLVRVVQTALPGDYVFAVLVAVCPSIEAIVAAKRLALVGEEVP